MSGAELVPVEGGALVGGPRELTVDELVAQTEKIREVQRRVMRDGVHFGVIPGVKASKNEAGEMIPPKPSLLKAGAETLCLLFRLAPEYEIIKAIETADEIAFTVRCTLVHIPTGIRYGSGLGSATSREKKYQREGRRRCPRCKGEAIYRSKDPQGGWFCWKTKGGCGANFAEGDQSIEGQHVGRVANPDLYDQHNSILKIAQKRAFVGTTLNCTAASDAFTQDLEDLPDGGGADDVRSPPANSHQKPAPAPRPAAAPAAPAPAPAGPALNGSAVKLLRKYHALRDRLQVSEAEGRQRVSVFLGREVKSIAELTGAELSAVIAAMEKEAEKGA